MRRRELLIGAGAALGARALAACAGQRSDAAGWADVKAQFALAPDLVPMAGFFLASPPRAVRDAIDTHRRGLDDNPYEYVEDNVASLEAAVRASAADYT